MHVLDVVLDYGYCEPSIGDWWFCWKQPVLMDKDCSGEKCGLGGWNGVMSAVESERVCVIEEMNRCVECYVGRCQ